MKLEIMALRDLPNLEEPPSYRTYLLRIQNSKERMPYDPPDHENLWVVEYVFDDCKPGERGVPLTDTVAKKMIAHFEEQQKVIDTLIVNCFIGKNRSPAVALAFNEIFHLGLDSVEFRKKYRCLNEYVYQTLILVSNQYRKFC